MKQSKLSAVSTVWLEAGNKVGHQIRPRSRDSNSDCDCQPNHNLRHAALTIHHPRQTLEAYNADEKQRYDFGCGFHSGRS
jgi:hypothetical protein